MRAEHRGKAMGIVQSAWGFGWAGAVLLYTLVFSLVSPDWAWRLLFAIGVITAGLVLYLRRNVADPPRAVTPIASSKQALPAARRIFDRSVIFFEAVETIEEIQRLSAGESGRTRARCADTGCSSSTTTIAS